VRGWTKSAFAQFPIVQARRGGLCNSCACFVATDKGGYQGVRDRRSRGDGWRVAQPQKINRGPHSAIFRNSGLSKPVTCLLFVSS
jgi:hypothetical protein